MSEIAFTEQIKKKNHIPFCIKMGIFLLLIFVKNVYGVSIPVSFFLILTCFITATGDRDEIITFAICCIPLFVAFQYKYAILICMITYYIKFSSDIIFNKWAIPLVAMMIWELLHAFGYNFSFNEYLRGFTELIFCTFLMISSYKKIDYALVCRLMTICTLVMMLIVLINLLETANYNFETIFSGDYRFGVGNEEEENFGINYNANGLGFICNLSIIGLLQIIILKKQNVADYAMIVLLLFFGLLTMSRSFIICCVMIFILFLFNIKKSVSSIIQILLSITLIIGTIYFIVINYAPFIIDRFVDRFQEADISNGRNDLWNFYSSHLNSNVKYLFFGVGMQDGPEKMYDIHKSIVNVPHNGIQEVLVYWGIPGLFIFLLFIWTIIVAARVVNNRYTLANYIPLILLMVKIQAGQVITSGQTTLAFACVYLSLCVDFKEEKNENTEEDFEISKAS